MNGDVFQPGDIVGRYRISHRVGKGGMGLVYRAHDPSLRRDVAIKVLPLDTSGEPEARARFLREAQSMAALNHSHICTVFEVGAHAGREFIAMEFIHGRTLQEHLPAGGLPAGEVLRLGIQIADALGCAHERGLVHRDLKPANVMLQANGESKVMDFGLARRVLAPDSVSIAPTQDVLTRTGTIVGTTPYMAPEAFHGAQTDARGDVWALGVILYELATGRLPFPGGTHYEVAAAIMNAVPAPLPDSVPAGLRGVISHCLEKEPGRRYRQGGEVRAALEAVALGNTPVPNPVPVAAAVLMDPAGAGREEAEDRRSRKEHDRAIGTSRLAWPAWVGGLAAIVVLVAVAPIVKERIDEFFRKPASDHSLAVLPLENLSHDAEQDYFADGMTEEISTRLAQISALRVIARGSAAGLVKQQTRPADMGRILGVALLLQGSVFTAEGKVAITVKLVNAATGDTRWAKSYRRPLVDILTLQSEVALAIAHEINGQLTQQDSVKLTPKGPIDPEAYRAYLKGRKAWQAYTLEGFQESERQHRRAIEIEPDYAPAWAGLADAAYGMSSMFLPPNEAMPRSRAAAGHALVLDSTLADAQISDGIVKMVYDRDWESSERSFRSALEIRPSDAYAHYWLGHLLALTGRPNEGLVRSRKALELDPLSALYSANLGWKLYFARRFAEARQQLKNSSIAHPDDYSAHVYLGLALEQMGDHAGSVASLERGVGMAANNDNRAQLAHAYGTAGRRGDALRVIHELEQERERGFVPAGNIAYAYAGLGDREQAFHWLDLGLEDHSEMLTALKADPGWDPVRGDPRFDQVLRRMNLLR